MTSRRGSTEVAPDRDTDLHGHLAVAHSHPRWIVDALAEALDDPGELEALLAADNAPPRVTLVARPGISTVAELEAAGGTPTSLSPYGVVLGGGDPGAIPAVAEGRAGVQDEGSQLVALAWPTPSWTDVTSAGSTCVPAPAARPLCWRALAAAAWGLVARARAPAAPRHARGVGSCAPSPPVPWTWWPVTGCARPGVPGTFDRVWWTPRARGSVPCGAGPSRAGGVRPSDVDVAGHDPAGAARRRASTRCGPGASWSTRPARPCVAETTDVVQSVLARRGDSDEVDRSQLWPHRDGTDAMFASVIRRR